MIQKSLKVFLVFDPSSKLHCPSLKKWWTEISYTVLKMGPKWKYPLRFSHLFLDNCRNRQTWEPIIIFMTFLREEKWFKNGVRVEKEDLINVKVLGQIDDKFIAIVTQNTNFLLLLDQHAVDERIRLETLLARKFITSKHKITNSLNDNILVRTFVLFSL